MTIERPLRNRFSGRNSQPSSVSKPTIRFLLGDTSGARSSVSVPLNKRYLHSFLSRQMFMNFNLLQSKFSSSMCKGLGYEFRTRHSLAKCLRTSGIIKGLVLLSWFCLYDSILSIWYSGLIGLVFWGLAISPPLHQIQVEPWSWRRNLYNQFGLSNSSMLQFETNGNCNSWSAMRFCQCLTAKASL